MNKIFLIIKREYLSRVKKKSFLIATILIPLLFPTIIGSIVYMAEKDSEDTGERRVLVLQEDSGLEMPESSRFTFIPFENNSDTAVEAFRQSSDFALIVPKDHLNGRFTVYSRSNLSISDQSSLENAMRRVLQKRNIDRLNLSEETVAALRPDVHLDMYNIVSDKKTHSAIAFGIGYIGGLLIYMFIFIYGAQVMQGVIEEKSSKIIEVLIAMVRPFQLMLGKIIGIASVGLTQFVIWIILMFVLTNVVFSFLGLSAGPEMQSAENMSEGTEILSMLSDIPVIPIILIFLFYFVGGYFLYGALFAAVGSAVDNQAEAQQFTLPITMPLIASIVGLSVILNNPGGEMAFWLSIIPLTSPVSMMARIGFGVPPLWELALSMSLLIGGFFLTTWIAGRIYRIGILSHGAKVNYKILARWFMQKN